VVIDVDEVDSGRSLRGERIDTENELISRRAAVWLLVLTAAVVAIIARLLPPIPQPNWYHMFADQRRLLGIPNFNNVVSNLPFAAVGFWGLVFVLRAGCSEDGSPFLDRRERWPYLMVFVGLILIASGSSYYHLQPDNTTLVWDRLPMVIVMMSLLAAILAERVSLRAGLLLMPLLVFIGLSSVLQWRLSEVRGAGDLRFYAAVQLYSVLFLVISLSLPSRYTRGMDLAIVAAFYVLAKILEALDRPIFDLGRKRTHVKTSGGGGRRLLDLSNAAEATASGPGLDAIPPRQPRSAAEGRQHEFAGRNPEIYQRLARRH